MDFISVISESSQYGTNYLLEYQVRTNILMRKEAARKTRTIRKKSPSIWGKVSDIEWKGDPYLAQRLNYDYELKYKLLHAEPKPLKGSISIHPQPKHGYTRIRTNYQLPSPDLFGAIDSIAKHVKSWA